MYGQLAVDDLYLHIAPVVRMSSKTWWVVLIGVANKMQYFRRTFTDLAKRFEA